MSCVDGEANVGARFNKESGVAADVILAHPGFGNSSLDPLLSEHKLDLGDDSTAISIVLEVTTSTVESELIIDI